MLADLPSITPTVIHDDNKDEDDDANILLNPSLITGAPTNHHHHHHHLLALVVFMNCQKQEHIRSIHLYNIQLDQSEKNPLPTSAKQEKEKIEPETVQTESVSEREIEREFEQKKGLVTVEQEFMLNHGNYVCLSSTLSSPSSYNHHHHHPIVNGNLLDSIKPCPTPLLCVGSSVKEFMGIVKRNHCMQEESDPSSIVHSTHDHHTCNYNGISWRCVVEYNTECPHETCMLDLLTPSRNMDLRNIPSLCRDLSMAEAALAVLKQSNTYHVGSSSSDTWDANSLAISKLNPPVNQSPYSAIFSNNNHLDILMHPPSCQSNKPNQCFLNHTSDCSQVYQEDHIDPTRISHDLNDSNIMIPGLETPDRSNANYMNAIHPHPNHVLNRFMMNANLHLHTWGSDLELNASPKISSNSSSSSFDLMRSQWRSYSSFTPDSVITNQQGLVLNAQPSHNNSISLPSTSLTSSPLASTHGDRQFISWSPSLVDLNHQQSELNAQQGQNDPFLQMDENSCIINPSIHSSANLSTTHLLSSILTDLGNTSANFIYNNYDTTYMSLEDQDGSNMSAIVHDSNNYTTYNIINTNATNTNVECFPTLDYNFNEIQEYSSNFYPEYISNITSMVSGQLMDQFGPGNITNIFSDQEIIQRSSSSPPLIMNHSFQVQNPNSINSSIITNNHDEANDNYHHLPCISGSYELVSGAVGSISNIFSNSSESLNMGVPSDFSTNSNSLQYDHNGYSSTTTTSSDVCWDGRGNKYQHNNNGNIGSRGGRVQTRSSSTTSKSLSVGTGTKSSGGHPRGSSERVNEITLQELSQYFNMPITQASKELKVGLTVLKKKCREFGIPRWPHRKMKSLDSLINNIQDLASEQGGKGSARVLNAVKELEEQKKLMEEMPGIELAERTKRLRQACFKASYKKRRLLSQQ